MFFVDSPLTESHVKVECESYNDDVRTIGDCLKHYADKLGDAEAIVFAATSDEEQRLAVSWNDAYHKSITVAKAFIHLGLNPGEKVITNVPTCPDWLYLTFGTILAGAIPLGYEFHLNDGCDLLDTMKRLDGCVMLILNPGHAGKNWEIAQKVLDSFDADGNASCSQVLHLRHVIGHEFTDSCPPIMQLHELLCHGSDDVTLPDVDAEDDAILFATSGSTGASKIAVHTHASMLCGRAMIDRGVYDSRLTFFNNDAMHWIGGFPFHLFYGQKRVTTQTLPKDEVEKAAMLVDVVTKERCNVMLTWGLTLTTLLSGKVEIPDDWPVEIIEATGQPMEENMMLAIGRLGTTLACSYGSTEHCLGSTTMVSDPAKYKEFNCGQLVPMDGLEFRVVDNEGRTVPVNQRGELLIRGPGMFREYINNPAKNKASKTSDGWFRTDDIAIINENGEVFVEGRLSNLILCKGDNIKPEEMESVYRKCPGVKDIRIVPVPDTDAYQVPCACVMAKDDVTLTKQDMERFAAETYNPESEITLLLPKYFMFVDAFPKTRTGKPSRKLLQKMAEDLFACNENGL